MNEPGSGCGLPPNASELQVRPINSAHDLVNEAIWCFNHFRARPWFRGNSNSAWGLSPSLFRQRPDGWKPPNWRGYELTLAHDFLRFAPSRQDRLPPLSDTAAWVCLMRHYGLPGRVLDWTTSILTAAWFAVSEQPGHCADVWALNVCGLNLFYAGENGHLSMRSGNPVVRDLRDAPFTREPAQLPSVVVGVIAPEIDPRMIMQQSVMTLHGDEAPMEANPAHTPHLVRLHIHKGAKTQIRRQLELLGVSRMTLFPDLANLAADLASWQYGDSAINSGP